MFHANKPYELPKLPPPLDQIQQHPEFHTLMSLYHDAQKDVSELNGTLREMENPSILLSLFYLNESIHSSAIENIYTDIESALEDEVKPSEERKQVNKEVINYRNAILTGHQSMKKFGLSSRTIKSIHKTLQVPKGLPGAFRKRQNLIVSKKTDDDYTVIYTPPKFTSLTTLLSNWEKFVHNDSSFFPLIKIAICHYQFEAIHPFEDGNGRVGRILIVLQLILEKMLDAPFLFISQYLNQNDHQYKELLLHITKKNHWWEFIQFMLKGYSLQAIETKNSLLKLRTAKKKLKRQLYNDKHLGIRNSSIGAVIDHIFHYPVTHAKNMASQTQIHWQTCSKYLNILHKNGVLSCKPVKTYKFYGNREALASVKPVQTSSS